MLKFKKESKRKKPSEKKWELYVQMNQGIVILENMLFQSVQEKMKKR